jgi:hypothetical protein
MAKNKFLFILAAASLLSLAACGNTNNSAPVASSSSSSSSQKPTSEGLVFQLNEDQQSYGVSRYDGTGTNVLIPETYESLPVTSIGDSAFNERVFLNCVALPATITSIGDYAFSDCTALASVALPASLTRIGGWAFRGCTALTGIALPASLTDIGGGAFEDCKGLVRFTVDPANERFETDGKALYDKGKTTLMYYAIGLADSSYAVPATVKRLVEWAFAGCANLASVALPSSLTSVGEGVFAGCAKLASFAVDSANKNFETDGKALYDKGKTELFQYAIGSADSSYALPATLTAIAGEAFYGCVALTSVAFAAGSVLAWIDQFAFQFCLQLTRVSLPSSLTNILSGAFYGCTSLATVNYAGTKEQWGKVSLASEWHEGCTLLKTVTCSDGTVTL